GNDDAMRAAELYAIAVADAVLDGHAAIPALPIGEDEFVELDAEGRPKAQTDGKRGAPAKRPARRSTGSPAGAPRGRTTARRPKADDAVAATAPAAPVEAEAAGADDGAAAAGDAG